MIRYWSVWTFCLLSHLFFALQWQRWKAWNCSGDAWVFHNRVFAASASQWPQRLHKLNVNQILLLNRKLFENFGLGSAAKGRVEIEWCFLTNISLSFEIVLQGSTYKSSLMVRFWNFSAVEGRFCISDEDGTAGETSNPESCVQIRSRPFLILASAFLA